MYRDVEGVAVVEAHPVVQRRLPHRADRKRPAEARENALAGTVVDVGYLGSLSIYQVRLDDGALMKATLSNQTRLVERTIGWNDRVWLSWPPEAAIVLTR